jgi:predicted nucleotidyltransferase
MEVMPMCYTLNEIKEKTVPIAQSYGIQSLGVFGSYARNEATDESDIDICVEKGSLRSLLQYFAFVQELEKNLGCHVDVITTEIEDTEFLNRVLAERVLLYER